MNLILNAILKDSAYKLTQFSSTQIEALENRIIDKEIRGKLTPHIVCLVRGKEIKLTPEEVVRQLYLMVLIDDLGYPVSRINIEYGVTFGRETKRADICIFDKDRATTPYILVELKKPKLKDGKEQLKSYCNATGAPIGVWSNGDSVSFYQRKDPNYFEDIPRIPSVLEKLSDVLSERWTISDLIDNDKLFNEKKSLKDLILEMEDEVLANAGVDVFEEVFKLVFTKLYDEMEGWRDKKRHLEFRNYGDTETELKAKIQNLFDKARGKWEGVFTEDSKLQLTPSHLAVCIASLESVKLFNSNLDVVDEAFEYLINKSSKGEKGQYFTPRYVIDMCVKMLNPQEHETLIDTAAGSCGFPVHGIFHVWEQILKEEGLQKSHLFTAEAKPARCTDYVVNKVFAIDFDEKAVRVGRTLNLIAGDGQTNVLHLNTLDYERWFEKTGNNNNPPDQLWLDIYGEGWKKLRKLRATKDENRDFGFDVLMANPPFAGDIKETRILSKYELARGVSLEKIKTVTEGDKNIQDISHRNPSFSEFLHVSHETIYKMADGTYRKVKIKEQSNVGRDILFIERNLNFLKSGGRMAVVLPQGRFNNSSDRQIREYISEHCRILAVVGLHGNVFKPHTGTKTSVLLVQKWDEKLCPKVDDYPIFFATMQEPSKDNSGDKIYVAQPDGSPLLDSHEHLIVKHDLFNHDGLTQNGIAEAFIEFAKKENLSFFDSSPFDEVSYRTLLEGLEISEISYSTIDLENRYDSEYFQKKYLVAEKFLKSKPNFQMGERYKVTDGEHGSVVIQDSGIKYLTAENIKKGYVDISNIRYVNEIVDRKNARARVQTGDILISIKGTLGEVAVAEEWLLPANMNRDVAILKPLSDSCQSEFLAVFLMSKYGAIQSLRVGSGGVQQMITLERLREFCIPILSDNFCIIICDLYKKSQRLFSESKTLYSQAENLLLDALGMADFSPSNENINIKSFKDSFFTTGRLDAEYYQPKYDDYQKHVFNYPNGWNSLIKICNLKDGNYTPEESTTYQYIELSNIDKSGSVTDCTTEIGKELPSRARRQVENGDVLISSIEGSLTSCALVPKTFDGALCSTGFYVINSHKINSETLLVLFKSELMQNILKQVCSGTILTAINKTEFSNLPVPLIEMETQTKIAELVQQSFSLKAESETLLELAKRAVEMAIEIDEMTATDFLLSNFKIGRNS